MGGCYATSFRYSSCSAARNEEEIDTCLRSFFRTKAVSKLIRALNIYEKQGNKKGFFKYLMEMKGEAVKELDDFEIESKLEIMLTPLNGKKEPGIVEIINAIEFPPVNDAYYIKDPVNARSVGENAFFGDDDERFVVIQKGGNWFLKEKGAVEHYSFGIPGEQIVLRRKETRIPTDPLKVAETITAKYGDGKTSYKGKIRKDKVDAFVMNTLTGRLYGMTVSDSTFAERRQLQLEVEYAGYIPGFTTDTDNERTIVEDVVNINKHVLFLHSGKSVNGWRVEFAPTTERKFDFVTGQKLLLNGGQNDSLCFRTPRLRKELADKEAVPR